MKNKLLAFGLLAFAPAAMWAKAHVEITGYRAQLSPSNQVRDDGSTIVEDSFGAGNVWIRTESPGGVLTKAVVDFNINWNIQRPMTMVRAFHIHVGGPAVNGPVVINPMIMPIMRERPGAGRRFVQVVIEDAEGLATVAALKANPGGYYVNLHTDKNRPGELRGQLRERGEHTLDRVEGKVDAGSVVVDAIAATTDTVLDLLARVASRLGLRP